MSVCGAISARALWCFALIIPSIAQMDYGGRNGFLRGRRDGRFVRRLQTSSVDNMATADIPPMVVIGFDQSYDAADGVQATIYSELVEELEDDDRVTVQSIQLGELLCDSLENAKDALRLQFAIRPDEILTADQTSYTEFNGTIFADGISRKVWTGEVVHDQEEASSQMASMTWGEVCDVEIRPKFVDGNLIVSKTIPCEAGGPFDIYIVELEIEFPDEGEPDVKETEVEGLRDAQVKNEENKFDAETGAIKPVRCQLQSTTQLPYTEESTTSSVALDNLGVNSDVAELRNTYGADFVHLVADLDADNIGGTCGLAHLPSSPIDIFAFGVVDPYCFFQFSHNMGCYHTREICSTQHDDAHGYRYCDDDLAYRTIMSYSCFDENGFLVPRVNYFSSLDVSFNGRPTGTAEDNWARRLETMEHYESSESLTPAPTTPITPEPTIPITSEPTISITPEPTIPITPEPTVPITPEPTVRITPEPTIPITPEPTIPITPEPTTPIAPEPTTPITPEPTIPITPEPTVPITTEPTSPITPEPTIPITPEPTIPITPEPTIPITPEPTIPITPEPTTPTTPEPTIPITPVPTIQITPEPTTPITPESTTDPTTCCNGIAGVESDGYCCPLGCGSYGGFGCSERAWEAGLSSKDCCITRIHKSGVFCETSGKAPCIVGGGPSPASTTPAPIIPITPEPTTPITPESSIPITPDDPTTCCNGIAGVESDGYCCPLGCGTCGGFGCSERAWEAGLSSKDCCVTRIHKSGVYCETSDKAPCIVGGGPSPASTTPAPITPIRPAPIIPIAPEPTTPITQEPAIPITPDDPTTCCNGIAGVERDGYCCSLGCRTCGGFGCNERAREAGLSSEDCCVTRIHKSDVYCEKSGTAPCIFGEGNPFNQSTESGQRSSQSTESSRRALAAHGALGLVEAGERTTVVVRANGYGEWIFGNGCAPDGCKAENTRDGSLSTRWACKESLLGGTNCEITFEFGDPQNLDVMRIAFYKGTEMTRKAQG